MRTVLALVAAASLAECSLSPKTTIEPVGQSPAGSVSPALASVPVGVVLGFQVKADSSAVVTAAVDDAAIVAVAPTTEASEFVLIGTATGTTTLHVFVDNQEAMQLPVQVTAPAP